MGSMRYEDIEKLEGYEWFRSSRSLSDEMLSVEECVRRIKMIGNIKDKALASIVLHAALENIAWARGYCCAVDKERCEEYSDRWFELTNAITDVIYGWLVKGGDTNVG